MSIRTTTTVFTNATDANFRAWGQWFRDCFSAAGWTLEVETFGTGTNWTDVTTPGAANQVRVTTVWKLADTLQATAPLYVKVEIGSGSVTANPGYRLTLGTGRSGSTITGILLDTGATHITATATTQIMTHYSSGGTGRINIMMAASGASWALGQMFALQIQRRKNGSGADVGTGFLLTYLTAGSRRSQGFLAAAVGPAATLAWYAPNYSTALAFDGKFPVGPVVHRMGPPEVGLELISIPSAVYAVGAEFDVTILGSSHHYLATQAQCDGFDGASSTLAVAMRYE